MTLGLVGVLLLAALVWTLVHASGRVVLWPAVLLLVIAEFLHVGIPR
jgi:hypothetical protein